MAAPLRKQSVNLAPGEVRVSRIRRDPPPVVKETIVDRDERNRRDAVIGVTAITLAILIIIYAVSNYNGWTPREYTIEI